MRWRSGPASCAISATVRARARWVEKRPIASAIRMPTALRHRRSAARTFKEIIAVSLLFGLFSTFPEAYRESRPVRQFHAPASTNARSFKRHASLFSHAAQERGHVLG